MARKRSKARQSAIEAYRRQRARVVRIMRENARLGIITDEPEPPTATQLENQSVTTQQIKSRTRKLKQQTPKSITKRSRVVNRDTGEIVSNLNPTTERTKRSKEQKSLSSIERQWQDKRRKQDEEDRQNAEDNAALTAAQLAYDHLMNFIAENKQHGAGWGAAYAQSIVKEADHTMGHDVVLQNIANNLNTFETVTDTIISESDEDAVRFAWSMLWELLMEEPMSAEDAERMDEYSQMDNIVNSEESEDMQQSTWNNP